jgi:hypothetical protein
MDRWAANTLRVLGIIILSTLVLLAAAAVLLISWCFLVIGALGQQHGQPPSKPEDVTKVIGIVAVVALPAILVIIGGLTSVIFLARQIFRSSPAAEPAAPLSAVAPSRPALTRVFWPAVRRGPVPVRLSPASRKLLDRLVLAMIAQILMSAVGWVYSQIRFWTAPGSLAPHNWISLLLGPFVLFHVPYALLIYFLLRQPTRRVLTNALAVPAVIIVQSLFSLSLVSAYYVRAPIGFLLLFLPWALHVVILVLAYRAIQRIGFHPAPSELLISALIVFVYFSIINGVTPVLYRFSWG